MKQTEDFAHTMLTCVLKVLKFGIQFAARVLVKCEGCRLISCDSLSDLPNAADETVSDDKVSGHADRCLSPVDVDNRYDYIRCSQLLCTGQTADVSSRSSHAGPLGHPHHSFPPEDTGIMGEVFSWYEVSIHLD